MNVKSVCNRLGIPVDSSNRPSTVIESKQVAARKQAEPERVWINLQVIVYNSVQ